MTRKNLQVLGIAWPRQNQRSKSKSITFRFYFYYLFTINSLFNTQFLQKALTSERTVELAKARPYRASD